jgi:hypothetical protein
VRVTATRLSDGAPVGVAAEQTLVWGADLKEGMSSPGVSAAGAQWFFPMGGAGELTTHLNLFNPGGTAAETIVDRVYGDGTVYRELVTVGALDRKRVTTPAGLPAGEYALEVRTTSGVVAADRAMYWGPDRNGGTLGVGSAVTAPRWVIAHGRWNPTVFTDVYVQNPTDTPVEVDLTFRVNRDDDPQADPAQYQVKHPRFVLAPHTWKKVNANAALAAFTQQRFSMEVDVVGTGGVVAEVTTYWPGNRTAWDVMLGHVRQP